MVKRDANEIVEQSRHLYISIVLLTLNALFKNTTTKKMLHDDNNKQAIAYQISFKHLSLSLSFLWYFRSDIISLFCQLRYSPQRFRQHIQLRFFPFSSICATLSWALCLFLCLMHGVKILLKPRIRHARRNNLKKGTGLCKTNMTLCFSISCVLIFMSLAYFSSAFYSVFGDLNNFSLLIRINSTVRVKREQDCVKPILHCVSVCLETVF